MCHGYVDLRLMMRETETRVTDVSFDPVPAPNPNPRPAARPGLVAALGRIFARPQPERETIAAE